MAGWQWCRTAEGQLRRDGWGRREEKQIIWADEKKGKKKKTPWKKKRCHLGTGRGIPEKGMHREAWLAWLLVTLTHPSLLTPLNTHPYHHHSILQEKPHLQLSPKPLCASDRSNGFGPDLGQNRARTTCLSWCRWCCDPDECSGCQWVECCAVSKPHSPTP